MILRLWAGGPKLKAKGGEVIGKDHFKDGKRENPALDTDHHTVAT